MASAAPAPLLGLSGPRRALAIAAAAVALTGFFVVLGFPYQHLVPRAEQLASAAVGGPVRIGRLELGLSWLTPQLRAWDVDATLGDGRRIHLDRMRVQPAVSPAWLRGTPALVVALRAPVGEVDGTVTLGDAPAFRGTLHRVQLSALPIADFAAGLTLDGVANADLDLAFGDALPTGTAKLDAEDGSLSLPMLPIGVPFDALRGEIALGTESALAEIASFEVTGPLVSLSASGTIGRAPVATAAPLALRGKIGVREPSLRGMIGGQGIRLDANGEAEVEIGGTLGEPETRSIGSRGRAR